MQKNQKKSKKIEKIAHLRGLESEYVPHAETSPNYKSIFTSEKGTDINTLYNVVKTSPEVSGCINAIVEDIMADGWRFIGAKSPVVNATKFQIESNFFRVLTNALIDLLITGNAYILKLAVREEEIKNVMVSLSKSLAEKYGVKMTKKIIGKVVNQPEFKKPKDLQLLKSGTVSINFDETGKVISYQQKVQSNTRIYPAEDIIHLSFMNIGGQPYGFTPLEPLLSDIGTLIFAKEFAGKYFENDGIPYFMFKLPKANPGDRNYKLLKKELNDLNKKENKYKAMVVTGEIEAEQINKFNKDMEFAKLIQHFTQIILMSMGVPAHRINLTIDVRQVGGAVNRAYEGYYKKIAFMQKAIENSLNKELWKKYFNVEMKFRRTYKIDEMREAQIIQILTQVGAITIEEAREMMGLDPQKPKGTEPVATGDNNAINFRQDKRREQGVEQIPDNTDNKVKGISDAIEVSWSKFRRIVESHVGYGRFDQANIVYIETNEEFILFFTGKQWTYKTRIPKSEIDEETFIVENLSNAVKIKL